MISYELFEELFRGFAMESPLWLDSLALADPFYVLPSLTSALMRLDKENLFLNLSKWFHNRTDLLTVEVI